MIKTPRLTAGLLAAMGLLSACSGESEPPAVIPAESTPVEAAPMLATQGVTAADRKALFGELHMGPALLDEFETAANSLGIVIDRSGSSPP